MTMFNVAQSVGEIVSIMPMAGEVFKRYNIDFCCGGDKSLGEAIELGKLQEMEVLQSLDIAFEESKKITDKVDFREMTSSNLIDYIVNTHHVYVKRVLPELSQLTTLILRVHGSLHPELFRVHKLFGDLNTELQQHLIKEEEILFPLIKEYDNKPSDAALEKIRAVMTETEDEHETAGNVLKELRVITNQYNPPEGACSSYYRTYEKLQELEADLFQHIHLENNILFKNI